MRDQVLKLIKEAGKPISGQIIAGELGLSRTAVWKSVQGLRKLGCEIVASPKVGYELKSSPDIILVEDLKNRLADELGGNVIYFDKVSSTNDAAKHEAVAGRFKEAGLVVAAEQTGGRGRFGRAWVSPRGGIWMSLVVRPQMPAVIAGRVALLAAVAVAEAVTEATGLPTKIKWPNDILINGKKVCGILTEMAAELESVEYLVIGVGLNANFSRDKLPGDISATTIQEQAGCPVDRMDLISRIVSRVFVALPTLGGGFQVVSRQWKDLSDTLGKMVEAKVADTVITGKAVDINVDGALVVELDSGERQILRAGEVSIKDK